MTGADTGERPGSSEFSARLVELFFRRWPVYLAPVLLFAAIGVLVSASAGDEFIANGTLSASANPLVSIPDIRTTEINDFETPAQGTARLVNEQLRTDSFVDEVIDRSGLTSSLEAGLIERDTIREQVRAVEEGQNFLTIESSWGDARTAFLLVDSTIEAYLDYVNDIVTGDSADAIQFLTDQQSVLTTRIATVERLLDDYVSRLPPVADGSQRPAEVQLELARLSGDVQTATSDFSDVQRQIDAAEVASQQAQSAAGRQLRVVDEPIVPIAPESSRLKKLIIVVMFSLIGLLVAASCVVVGTLLDRSVRLRKQVARVCAADVAVAIPHIGARRAPTPRTRRRKAA